ncbi:MAG: putative bacteriocin export ABC transporter [Lachnospiraceae bacterium]|nr:putative bacteriocin export ABC transporter [Lachnospiraceae bacterium]
MFACQLLDITKRYKKKVVFEKYNLEIEKGESVAIVGKSGSGKSTLLNLIGLMDSPDAGVVKLFGEEVSSKRQKFYLRNKISYLYQNFALIDHLNVKQNLEVALTYVKATKQEKLLMMEKALEDVGLTASFLLQKVYALSGGEQQRVALARALLKPCELILADEPTGSLDVENRDLLLQLLVGLNRVGKTLIIVTHDGYVASCCKRMVRI